MRTLAEIRVDIDNIDQQIQDLLMARLDCSEEVIRAKIEDRNFIINRPDREIAMLERLGAEIVEDRRAGYLAVVRKIIETSRMFQYGRLYEEMPELFEKLAEGIDLTRRSEMVTVRLERPDMPNGMSAILAMIGDYGFDMEQLKLMGYEDHHRKAVFELMIRGDIRGIAMQKLLLQLSMEAEHFQILEVC